MLNALKQRIAASMAKRNYVRHLVQQDLHHDPEFTALTVRSLLESPEDLTNLLRDATFFKAVLSRYARNPEALYRLLRLAPLSGQLKAQGEFLDMLARNGEMVEELLRNVPAEQRPGALRALLQQDAAVLSELADDGPLALAAVAVQARGGAQDAEPAQDNAVLQSLVRYIGDQRAEFVAILAQSDHKVFATLMENKAARDQVVQIIAADRDALASVMELAVFQQSNGATVGARLKLLLEILTNVPAFRLAMQRDPELRQAHLAFIRDTFESAGQSLETELADT